MEVQSELNSSCRWTVCNEGRLGAHRSAGSDRELYAGAAQPSRGDAPHHRPGYSQGHKLESEQYALAREGNQMFGVLTFKGEHSEMGLSIGFRNSYDKSMAIGIAIGAKVFVCDNLALSGEITVLRKHTGNVWASLEDVAISTLYRSQKNFQKIVEDAEFFKNEKISDTGAFQFMGLLYGRGVLTPRQLPLVKREWLKPSHEDFQPRNLWSFYNACTEAMKSAPPVLVMEKHIKLHEVMMGELRG